MERQIDGGEAGWRLGKESGREGEGEEGRTEGRKDGSREGDRDHQMPRAPSERAQPVRRTPALDSI